MGKKESRRKFSEAIDPRFTGMFENNSCKLSQNKNRSQKDKDKGFRDVLSKKLFDYADSKIKVKMPVEENDLLQFQIDDIRLLPNLPIMTENVSTPDKIEPPKKKRKKKEYSEEDLFKQVAVTADVIKRQAEIFNS
ncbi:uncharacterized protein NPIL_298851 [Nephila pilipes]|uniref:Uncharacterized protein n=1 Tax=Nephila pilipes TaxID=299642 RepID=A0A8X6QFB2_NEPPI|nr:uncharacterized protein NPIL_298851 [Nephila pilipes]